jgi:hypothetical protein
MTVGRPGIDYTTGSARNGPSDRDIELAVVVRMYLQAIRDGNMALVYELRRKMQELAD